MDESPLYRKCPECGNLKLIQLEKIIRESTRKRSGLKKIFERCTHSGCGFERVVQKDVIPRLRELPKRDALSSDIVADIPIMGDAGGGFGGFGGGDSGGGGAGHGW